MRRHERELAELAELAAKPDGERIAQLEREAQYRRRRVRLLIRGYFVLAVAIALAIFGVARVQHRQGSDEEHLRHDEAHTCAIQAKGLPASKHLAAAMGELSAVLTPPKGQSLDRVPEPARMHLEALRREASAYRELEGEQPSGRSC